VAEDAGRGARCGRDAAHEWRQDADERHAARRGRQSAAGQPLHEPVPEALAPDRAFQAHAVNYADDFVILSRGHAAQALAWTKDVMTRIGLTLNEAKTSLKDARHESFDFLGYTFGPRHAWGDGHVYLGANPSRKSVQRLKTKVGDMLVSGEKRAWPEVCKRLNRMLTGWAAYFSHGALRSAYTAIDRHVGESVRMFLSKRSKSHGRGARKFSQDKIFGELGVKRLMRWGSGSTSTVSP
jgi:RNA-directed DNA polymerase